jgi:hypothetical protein
VIFYHLALPCLAPIRTKGGRSLISTKQVNKNIYQHFLSAELTQAHLRTLLVKQKVRDEAIFQLN